MHKDEDLYNISSKITLIAKQFKYDHKQIIPEYMDKNITIHS